MNRSMFLLVWMLVCVAGPGCRGTRGAGEGSAGPIVTPGSGVVGRVIWVNTRGRFVVVRFPIGQLPEAGERLSVYREGLKVGEVSMNGPRSEDNTVADLVAGEASNGDLVRRE